MFRSHAPRPRLSAGAAALTALFLVTACEDLPEQITGSVQDPGAGSPGTDTGEQRPDPADAETAVRGAAEQVRGAGSYHVEAARVPDGGDAFATRTSRATYTEDPESALHYFEAGEGATDITLHRTADDTVLGAWGDGFFEVLEQPTRPDEYRADFGFGAAKLEEIAETSTDLAHEGTVEHTVEGAEGERTVTAEQYAGTFTAQQVEFEGGGIRQVLTEHEGSEFTLWIDEQGRPVELEHRGGGHSEVITYERIGEPEQVDTPEAGDPAIP